MDTTIKLNSIFPLGATDPQDLPVGDVSAAIPFYTDKLGFTLKTTEGEPPMAAVLMRDDVELRLAQNGDDPEQASCYIDVTNLDALHREYQAHEIAVSESITEMEHDGRQYRVMWLKDADGICYCLGTPAG